MAGYTLEVAGLVATGDDRATLRQSPPEGWQLAIGETVRISLEATDDLGRILSLPQAAAHRAISIARQLVSAARPSVWMPVELVPTLDDGKGGVCPPPQCVIVRLNSTLSGASVFVDLRKSPPAAPDSVSHLPKPFAPSSLYSDEELITAVLNDPVVSAALAGRGHAADVVGSGAPGPPCDVPGGLSVCVTVLIEVEGASPALVSVNYMTLEVRLDEAPRPVQQAP
jgi:hypothetical protein